MRPQDPASAAWIAAANLSALAHFEIAWEGETEWRAAPPVITMLPNSGGRALLTGARTRTLYRRAAEDRPASGRLVSAVDELDLWVDVVDQPDGPSSVLIASNRTEDAEQLAELCGVEFSYSVSEQLSMLLPGLDAAVRLGRPAPVPQGFPVERFDTAELRWRESTEEEAAEPGLSRIRTWQAHVHILTTPMKTTLHIARQPAVFEVLRWEAKAVLQYDADTWELWTPVNARLPLLQERAAVLCTGLLPRFQVRDRIGGIRHFNVPPSIAERIARSLDQSLRSG